MFREYFDNRLRSNPYYDEIMELIKKQEEASGAAGGGGAAGISEDGGDEIKREDLVRLLEAEPLIPYRISTMTCIYDIGKEINEYKLYDISTRLLAETENNDAYDY